MNRCQHMSRAVCVRVCFRLSVMWSSMTWWSNSWWRRCWQTASGSQVWMSIQEVIQQALLFIYVIVERIWCCDWRWRWYERSRLCLLLDILLCCDKRIYNSIISTYKDSFLMSLFCSVFVTYCLCISLDLEIISWGHIYLRSYLGAFTLQTKVLFFLEEVSSLGLMQTVPFHAIMCSCHCFETIGWLQPSLGGLCRKCIALIKDCLRNGEIWSEICYWYIL